MLYGLPGRIIDVGKFAIPGFLSSLTDDGGSFMITGITPGRTAPPARPRYRPRRPEQDEAPAYPACSHTKLFFYYSQSELAWAGGRAAGVTTAVRRPAWRVMRAPAMGLERSVFSALRTFD